MNGWLHTVVEANDLMGKSAHGTTSSPYVKIKLAHQKAKTSVIGKNLNPRWNETFILYVFEAKHLISCSLSLSLLHSHSLNQSVDSDVEDPNDKLKIAVFDHNKAARDAFLGTLSNSFDFNLFSHFESIIKISFLILLDLRSLCI
jgi:Ca2+-dependent lipid-binding protein